MHLTKRRNVFIFLIILIFLLLLNIQSSLAVSWDSCPFGLENDPYPGECGRYIDTNQDGICDLSQPNPNDYASPADKNTAIVTQGQTDSTTDTFVSPEDHEYSVEISGHFP